MYNNFKSVRFLEYALPWKNFQTFVIRRLHKTAPNYCNT